MSDEQTPVVRQAAAGGAAFKSNTGGKTPPWAALYRAWKDIGEKGIPSWFVAKPSCRKYIANLVLFLLLGVTGVWSWMMGEKGYAAWRYTAAISLAMVVISHLVYALATMGNKRVIMKMKVLMPHIVLVLACVVLALLAWFNVAEDKAGAMRPMMVYACSALAAIYGLWTLAKISWRKLGMCYEVHENSMVTKIGIFGRKEEDTPLIRINDISVSRTFTQRMLGVCTVDIISTDNTDIDNTPDKMREVLGLKKTEGVLELTDMPSTISLPDSDVKEALKKAAREKGKDIPDEYLEERDVEAIIQNRMHWIRKEIMVVVDSGN